MPAFQTQAWRWAGVLMSPDTAVARDESFMSPVTAGGPRPLGLPEGLLCSHTEGERQAAICRESKARPSLLCELEQQRPGPFHKHIFWYFPCRKRGSAECYHSLVLANATGTHRPATALANVPASCSTWAQLLVFLFLPGETEKQCFTDSLIFCKDCPANTRGTCTRGSLSGTVAPRGRPCAKQSRTHAGSAQERSAFG